MVKVATGQARNVQNAITGRPGVTSADVIMGMYDIIAQVQGNTVADIANVVLTQIQNEGGVEDTQTCLVV